MTPDTQENGGNRTMSNKATVLLMLALVVAAIAGFRLFGYIQIRAEYGQGMEKFRAGEYSAAADVLTRPAEKKYKDAAYLLKLCRILESADKPTKENIQKLKSFLGSSRSEEAREAAQNRLTELGTEAYEKGMFYYQNDAYGNAKDPLELAAAAGIPDAEVYYSLSCAMSVSKFYHDFEEAEKYVRRAEKVSGTPELLEECRRTRESVQEIKETWETTELVEIRNSDPYVLMLEKDLPETRIGRSCRYEKETKEVKAKNWTDVYTNYRYYSGNVEVFRVKCMNGMVYEVEDLRGSSQTESKTGRKSGTNGNDITDPFSAEDYAHPDDFYYWYPDDFWDYEDAEDYWEEYN